MGSDAVTVLKGQLGPRDGVEFDAKVRARKSLLFHCPADRIFGHWACETGSGGTSSTATSGTKEWGQGGLDVVKSRPGKKCRHSPGLKRQDGGRGAAARVGRDAFGRGHDMVTSPPGSPAGQVLRKWAERRGGPHLCHVDELVQHLPALCRPGAAQHHDLHPAGHAVAETYGSLQGRAAPHGALQNVAPQVLGLGVR